MSSVQLEPIGHVSSARTEAVDDAWDSITSTVALDASRFTEEALRGLDEFSHVEVVYLFDRVATGSVVTKARHPRGNPEWPQVGIFTQRAKARPNRLGVTVCRLLAVEGLTLTVSGLDAIDGSPVLDINDEPAGALGEVREFPLVGRAPQRAGVQEGDSSPRRCDERGTGCG